MKQLLSLILVLSLSSGFSQSIVEWTLEYELELTDF